MPFGSTLLYFSLYVTSMVQNSPSKTNLPSGVAPKITFTELITKPHGSTTVLCPFHFLKLS